MSTAIWALEWRQAARRRRVMAFSAGVPLLLVGAVALGRAPAPHAALVYTVLFTFFGAFGAAVPWARDEERGWLHRLVLTGVGMPWLAVQRVLAAALIDLIELIPSLLVIALVYRVTAVEAVGLVIAVAWGLLTANTLGVLVACIAASLAETALLASVAALLLLHGAGVFRAPGPGSVAEAVQPAVPFHYMHEAIRAAVGAP
jgi:ABC-type transport system involved in cytochrome c biogenesis permease component